MSNNIKPNFTPGPWGIFRANEIYIARKFSSINEDFIAQMIRSTQSINNAKLIVMAPEMYECLKRLKEALSYDSSEKRSERNLKHITAITQLHCVLNQIDG